ncbi:DUF805 domain-containing protein [Parahaliea sp. F7430]|uniref:DUF805 domain-containing protein n=1 Tax=Sediminihaliea albiluteola TaxID=2758564 RepID=A0A7W2TX90_9GAMM|nr:DUF805 domain-containing protein [Sediminihaliea albiluteola]MBA6413633.1 DUF805 domain-containing protein [Sediminihaliea albiluteola]
MEWYLKVLKNYLGFSGRARRVEFWMFVLINFLISVVLSFVDGVLGLRGAEGATGVLQGLYMLGVFLPSIAVAFRRLHDTGRSGWWLLIGLVPVIGWIVLLVFYCFDSEEGDNAYGPNPKLEEA